MRTHAPRKGDRDAAALQPSLDLDMLQRLISPAAYRNVTRDGVSFLAAMRMLQAFLEDNKAAGPRASQEGVAPGAQADPPDGVPPMETAARLVSEICKHGDTLDIYIHCAPKLG
ncbi:hypothetical protein C7R54_14340 [Achromobacter aloeverae]|uniref:Uncharacterized protein n=1 Tax=Achromobacter aloeverae TaxID=1750518 RepID=A0A4Q1HKH0_9BURK|nr:hypothetical protein C7R54_14340 [Achromobacter aloeverae]